MLALVSDSFKLARAGYIITREGLLRFVPQDNLPLLARWSLKLLRLIERRNTKLEGRSKRLSVAFARLGPSWVKFGQLLATRPDVVGIALARDLEVLQDQMPPFSQSLAEQHLKAVFGASVEALFLEFGPPVAAASIAQVHRAKIKTSVGEQIVAVKILRPHIVQRFKKDMRAFFRAAKLVEFVAPSLKRLKPVGLVETLQQSVTLEMDLRLEAAALSELSDNTNQDIGFRVPQVNWDYTARTILTTEWIDGTPIRDLTALKEKGHDLKALAQQVIQSFLKQALRDGFFHADMHQGNLFVDTKGNLVAVDCGIMGRLEPRERRYLAEILYGFIARDYRRGSEVHFEAGYVPKNKSVALFAQALRAVGEPIHQKTAEQIPMAQVILQLFDYTELFDMQTRLELVLLQKTMVVVEGVARTLDPELDMWATAEPVVTTWFKENFGPKGQMKLAQKTAVEVAKLFADAPEHVRTFNQMLREDKKDNVILFPKSDAWQKAQTIALWLIAVMLAAQLFWLLHQ